METACDANENRERHEAVHRQIRGSGLLLAGRAISTTIIFVSQVMMVRHLSTSEYGAFAYALSMVAASQSFSTLGLHKSISRFVPIYQEKRDPGRIAGSVLLSVSVIALCLLLISFAVVALPHAWLEKAIRGDRAITILSILVFLVPVEALNDVLISLFASFGRPRDIFFRSHVLAPGLRLVAVIALIATNSGAVFLAFGYVAASLIGTLWYAAVLMRFVGLHHMFEGLTLKAIRVPARDMFSFAIPILTSEFVTGAMMTAISVIMLGYFHTLTDVAIFRAAVPAARMNLVVMASFSLLFTPHAARLFAKSDFEGVNDLYWRTTAWLTLLTLPLFIATFSLSQPLTLLLYGSRYEASGKVLALLSLANYFNVALGFNTLTLRVFGKLRPIIVVNVTAAVADILLNFALVPRFGAMGAAVATTVSMLLLNLMTQFALRSAPGFKVLDPRYASVYVFVIVASGGLFLVESLTSPNIYVAGIMGAVTCVAVLVLCKKNLAMAESFPEVTRIPLLRAIFS